LLGFVGEVGFARGEGEKERKGKNTGGKEGDEGVSLRRTQNDDVLYGGFFNLIFFLF
jgi:hypothetical protein